MPKLTLEVTAHRILNGTDPQVAIKEHIDAWNRSFDSELFLLEPPLTGQNHIDAWIAGAAEYEAFMLDEACPDWANASSRFLKEPFFMGGKNSRMIDMTETPFAFRRRLVFSGKTTIRHREE